jgi:hypothetical protein
MDGSVRRWRRRLWAGAGQARDAAADRPAVPDHASGRVPGRAHLVLRDGSVVEAPLGPQDRGRVEYLARRAAAPPPPPAKRPEHPL